MLALTLRNLSIEPRWGYEGGDSPDQSGIQQAQQLFRWTVPRCCHRARAVRAAIKTKHGRGELRADTRGARSNFLHRGSISRVAEQRARNVQRSARRDTRTNGPITEEGAEQQQEHQSGADSALEGAASVTSNVPREAVDVGEGHSQEDAPASSAEDAAEYEDALREEREASAKLKAELQRAEQRERALRRAISGRGMLGSGVLGDVFVRLRELAEDSLGIQRGIDDLPMDKLDIQKMKACFSYTDFWAVAAQRYGNGAMFEGNLRADLGEVRAKLEPKLAEAAGQEVAIFFLLDDATGKQVVVVQPAREVEARLRYTRMSGLARWPLSALGVVACALTTLRIAGVNLDPLDMGDPRLQALPFGLGLAAVLGVGEIFQRIMAVRYGVKLSPPYLIPGPLGCLGAATRFESLVPSRQALLDIAAARAVGSAVAALVLASYALATDGGTSGGANPLYVEPEFFQPNLLVSFIQYVIGPYADDLGNVMPNAVEGVGVPVNPLAFAGLLGLIVTALNLLPAGQLEGGRIAQALFGRRLARAASFWTTLILGIGGVTGSVLCLTWGFIILFFRNGQELPCEEEVTGVNKWRVFLSWILLAGSILLLLPNSAGTFPSFLSLPKAFPPSNL